MDGKTLAIAVGMTGVAAIAVGTLALYAGGPPDAPERPKAPPPPEQLMNSELRYSPTVYRALIEQDAKQFGVPVPKLETLVQPNAYFEELKSRRKLKARSTFETRHLRLTLEVVKHQARLSGQAFSSDHLVLRIENRTPRYLAYRVATSVSDKHKCLTKGDLAHNALVLEPNQTITRSECLYRSDENVELTHVEVMELPALSAYYVSRLPPNPMLYDARTAAGHVPLHGEPCPQTFSWRDIKEGIDTREFGWRDVIDFYARHHCSEYSFFTAYRYRSDPSAPLPARPLD